MRGCLTAPGIDAPAPPSPAEVAERAIALLPLGEPAIELAPGDRGLVGLPVWLWVDTSEANWGPISRTAEVRGASVTATAEADSVTWDLGDGTVKTCDGPGTPYKASYGAGPSPTCGHVYRGADTYRITATTHWSITWEGGGASGSEAMRRSSSADLRVIEAQSVN
jgi:hypothetical protein